MSKKSGLTKAYKNSKNFSYAKGLVNLDFTLNVDNSSELKDFLSCLEAAVKDIDELLLIYKN